jgi:hypothetical protein
MPAADRGALEALERRFTGAVRAEHKHPIEPERQGRRSRQE